ncbi:MAG: hypothetical protein ACFE75_14230, partial [Candidatus Hodarchaeota archaeon]
MKPKFRKLNIIILLFILGVGTIPSVLALTRNSYLTNFLLKNEIVGEGFSNVFNKPLSLEATSYALEILQESYGISPQDRVTLQTKLEDKIKEMIDNDIVNLYDLYYLLKSLDILDSDISINEPSYFDKIYKYLNDTEQVGGGFSYSNASTSVSMTSTYYVVQLYSLLEISIENVNL